MIVSLTQTNGQVVELRGIRHFIIHKGQLSMFSALTPKTRLHPDATIPILLIENGSIEREEGEHLAQIEPLRPIQGRTWWQRWFRKKT